MYGATKAPWLSFVRELEELNCSGLRLSKEPSLLAHALFLGYINDRRESVAKNNGGDDRLVDAHNGARIRKNEAGRSEEVVVGEKEKRIAREAKGA